MELTFTAENNGQYVPLDSIFIENPTHGGDTTLYAPDTVLVIDYETSIGDKETIRENALSVSQNYPNPFMGKTEFILYLPDKENIKITGRDILGRDLVHFEKVLIKGNHTFSFYSDNEKYYLLTVSGKKTSKTIKMLNANSNTVYSGKCKIVYNGFEGNEIIFKSHQAINNFGFSPGDELKYTAYSDMGERTITDSPTVNQTYTFQFATGTPCPGMPTLTDIDGNVYNTVLIGSQCWMKENLKTTKYQNGTPIPNVTDGNSWNTLTTGAYVWYANDISWKDLYGALYNWYTIDDLKGLCPTGWHVPTNNEWTSLTDFIGGINSPHGNELKSCRQVNSPQGGGCNTTEHPRWIDGGQNGTDDYGFSGLPGGVRGNYGTFFNFGNFGFWWSSSEYSSSNVWFRILFSNDGCVFVDKDDKRYGFSVRCLRD